MSRKICCHKVQNGIALNAFHAITLLSHYRVYISPRIYCEQFSAFLTITYFQLVRELLSSQLFRRRSRYNAFIRQLFYSFFFFVFLSLADRERDYIGFASLPDQIHRKSVKRGFEFTLMVVGESGLGKSTLINSLFLADLYKNRQVTPVEERSEKTTRIEKKTLDIEEKGVRLRLNVIDTPGFGDGINADDSWRAVVDYIDEQFRQYFMDESGLNRKNIQDNRVHCCLYAVPPWGHRYTFVYYIFFPYYVMWFSSKHEREQNVFFLHEAFVLVVLYVKGHHYLLHIFFFVLSIINSHSHYYYHNNFPTNKTVYVKWIWRWCVAYTKRWTLWSW